MRHPPLYRLALKKLRAFIMVKAGVSLLQEACDAEPTVMTMLPFQATHSRLLWQSQQILTATSDSFDPAPSGGCSAVTDACRHALPVGNKRLLAWSAVQPLSEPAATSTTLKLPPSLHNLYKGNALGRT